MSAMPPAQDWDARHRQGVRCQLAGQWQEARRCFTQALALNPDHAPTQLALAQLDMYESGFQNGRDGYEVRFAARGTGMQDGMDWRGLPTPRWRGEPLAGKHLHLWVEQGLGDVVMYAGFLPHLLAQGARITLSMFPKMMSLFARSFPAIHVESLQEIGRHAAARAVVESFPPLQALARQTGMALDLEPMRRDYEQALARGLPDYAAPMGDLMVYGLPEFVPARLQASYLAANAPRVAAMRRRLQGQGRLVGIAWHSFNEQSGAARSIPLDAWLPVLRAENCRFVSLQHGVPSEQIERFCAKNGCRIHVEPQLDIVADTEGQAALIASMDEVITIDNSTVHLAGALGVSITLLLPKGCDFRWPLLDDGEKTLWYRSVTALRQQRAGDWGPVMEQMAQALRRRG